MKYCALLPAYNEEQTIAELVKDIRDYGLDVIVVDDGSTDDTVAVAQENKAVVLTHNNNSGKGKALRTGFDHIIGKEYDGVIIMDADGQHSPSEINEFLKAAGESKAGIILGNRMQHPEGMPFVRRMTNKLTSSVVSSILGYEIPDSQCGFRLIKTDVLRKLDLFTIKYDTETEILLEASRNGFNIESVPIRTVYLNQKSKINPLIDTMRFWLLIFKNILRKK
ncbi:MAG: glycosyltransferase family 2 protein [PVC group bacterium]|nr:glycosyltransferase family 2 protein [PVC group bacterium]